MTKMKQRVVYGWLVVTVTITTTMVIIAAFAQQITIMTHGRLTNQRTNKRETVIEKVYEQ